MAIPQLPPSLAESAGIAQDYERWKARVQAAGMTKEAITKEYLKVWKPRWKLKLRQDRQFEAESEKLRKKYKAFHESTEHLRTASKHRLAIPISLQNSTLTPLEVVLYGSDSGHPPYSKLMRQPVAVTLKTPLIRPEWMSIHGFLVDGPDFVKFMTLLYAETMSSIPNYQAAELYNLLDSNNNDGKSAFKRVLLRATGEPVPFQPSKPRMADLPHMSGNAFLSHPFLNTKLTHSLTFEPGDVLTGPVLEYLANSNIKDDCGYRAIITALKNSWDKYEDKKKSTRKSGKGVQYLDHAYLGVLGTGREVDSVRHNCAPGRCPARGRQAGADSGQQKGSSPQCKDTLQWRNEGVLQLLQGTELLPAGRDSQGTRGGTAVIELERGCDTHNHELLARRRAVPSSPQAEITARASSDIR
jgi:hypothetical protein